jgi:hypothetical protein
MTARKTQQQRIVEILQSVRSGHHEIPDEYLRHHPDGDGISTRYFKQMMFISECNGRMSELKDKGYVIETSTEKDRWGFAYHRLVKEPAAKQLSLV